MDLGMAFMNPLTAIQQYGQREQAFPAELAGKQAQTRLATAEAERMEMQTAADRKAADLMNRALGGMQAPGEGQPASQSISDQLYQQAQIWTMAGDPTKANQLLNMASQAKAREQQSRSQQVLAALRQADMGQKQLKSISSLLEGVKDQESWDSANRAYEQATGQPSPLANTPYDPELVSTLREGAMTEYQRQQLRARQSEIGLRAENLKDEMRHRGVMEGIAAENTRVRQQQAALRAKTGGKDIGEPAKAAVDQAYDLLADANLGGDRQPAAYSIASDAKALQRRNPALSSDDAIRQVLAQRKSDGSLKPGAKGWLSSTPGKFSKALPLPAKASDLVAGQSYTNPKTGKAFVWTGKGWEQPVGTAPASGSSDDEDENDDAAE